MSIECRCLLLHSLNRWRPLVPAPCLVMLLLTLFVFCKRVFNCIRNAKLIIINSCNISIIAQVPYCIDINHGCVMT